MKSKDDCEVIIMTYEEYKESKYSTIEWEKSVNVREFIHYYPRSDEYPGQNMIEIKYEE